MIVPEVNAFSKIITPPLHTMRQKPRKTGLTMVIDKGLGISGFDDMVETANQYIDIVKFGFGTAFLYPQDILTRKLRTAKLYGVDACVGGTLGEIAFTQGVFKRLVEVAAELGFSAMEISDGIINLPTRERRMMIKHVKKSMRIITEVGKKLEAFPSSESIAKQILSDFDAGAEYVIVEGRESGINVGIFDKGGQINDAILDRLVTLLPREYVDRIIWEAPRKDQQVHLIARFSPSVNIGNVHPSDVYALECLRTGLRGDTFQFALQPKPNE